MATCTHTYTHTHTHTHTHTLDGSEIPEAVLLRDIIFAFQNIDGEVIRFDSKQEAYRIDEKVSNS